MRREERNRVACGVIGCIDDAVHGNVSAARSGLFGALNRQMCTQQQVIKAFQPVRVKLCVGATNERYILPLSGREHIANLLKRGVANECLKLGAVGAGEGDLATSIGSTTQKIGIK